VCCSKFILGFDGNDEDAELVDTDIEEEVDDAHLKGSNMASNGLDEVGSDILDEGRQYDSCSDLDKEDYVMDFAEMNVEGSDSEEDIATVAQPHHSLFID
jgi:hypothetical protein